MAKTGEACVGTRLQKARDKDRGEAWRCSCCAVQERLGYDMIYDREEYAAHTCRSCVNYSVRLCGACDVAGRVGVSSNIESIAKLFSDFSCVPCRNGKKLAPF